MDAYKFPRVSIEFCAACKWHNRAVWYLQEVMQTFSDPEKNFIPEVALQPVYNNPGLFQVVVIKDANSQPEIIYKRKFKKQGLAQEESYYFDGFPDSKLLKGLLRDKLFPQEQLGHTDKYKDVLNDGSCRECKVQE